MTWIWILAAAEALVVLAVLAWTGLLLWGDRRRRRGTRRW